MTQNILDYLIPEHRQCDEFLALTETYIQNAEWDNAKESFIQFNNLTLLHFKREEEVLFVALERSFGSPIRPVFVMTHEHQQTRQLLNQIKNAIDSKNKSEAFALLDTCHLLIQQHNLKEENNLYTLANQTLENQMDQIINDMKMIKLN